MNNESHESSSIGNQMLMNIKASTQSEQNEYPDNQEPIRKTYIEQKDRKDKELNNLLNNMKDKMDKGRNLNSPMSSMRFTGNNFSNNISNRNSGISQSPFSGNNIGMNMNNNAFDQNNNNINDNNMNVVLDNGIFNNNTMNSNHSIIRNSAYDDEDDNENENVVANNVDNYLLKSNPGSVFMNNSQNINNSNQNSLILNNNNNNNNQNPMFANKVLSINNPNSLIMNNNNNSINNNNFNNNLNNNIMNNMNMNQNSNNIINNNMINMNMNNNMMNNMNNSSRLMNNMNNSNNMMNNSNNMMNNMNNNSRLMNNNMINVNNNNIMNNNNMMNMNNSSRLMNNNMINLNNNNIMDNNNMINNMNMNNNNNMINTSNSGINTLNMLNNNLAQNMDNNFNSNKNFNDGDIKYDNNIINDSNPILQDPQPGKKLFPMDNTQKNSKILDSKHSSINSKNQIKPINKDNISLNKSKNPLDTNDQEIYDSLKKSQIIDRHSIMSSYYDYTPGEREDNLNELLEDMHLFGEIKKRDIEKQKRENPNKFISIEDAMEKGKNSNDIKSSKKLLKYKNEYFVLSILAKALMSQGCTVEIEKDEPKNEEEKNEMNTTMQFLVNGMYNFKKYIFHFDFGDKANKELLKQTEKQTKFNGHLKNRLVKLFNLKVNDIIMTDPRIEGSYSITAIIKKASFDELSEDKIYQFLKNERSFNKIKKVEKRILLSGCILNVYMLDSRGNNKDGGWGFNETRGGYPYYPPEGWTGYGLRVVDRFDKGNNVWLDYHNKKGEWAVAYHGIGYGLRGSQLFMKIKDIGFENIKTGVMQEFQDSDDKFHKGEKVGEGIYVTPKPEVSDEYCGKFDYDGKKYKIAFMTRVMPDKIRCPVDNENIWVINGTDNEIRPYRILIKEV